MYQCTEKAPTLARGGFFFLTMTLVRVFRRTQQPTVHVDQCLVCVGTRSPFTRLLRNRLNGRRIVCRRWAVLRPRLLTVVVATTIALVTAHDESVRCRTGKSDFPLSCTAATRSDVPVATAATVTTAIAGTAARTVALTIALVHKHVAAARNHRIARRRTLLHDLGRRRSCRNSRCQNRHNGEELPHVDPLSWVRGYTCAQSYTENRVMSSSVKACKTVLSWCYHAL